MKTIKYVATALGALVFTVFTWWAVISIAGSAIKIGLDDCESVYPIMSYFRLQIFC
jgi:hypothetical protein